MLTLAQKKTSLAVSYKPLLERKEGSSHCQNLAPPDNFTIVL
jgi:hypothetical protein